MLKLSDDPIEGPPQELLLLSVPPPVHVKQMFRAFVVFTWCHPCARNRLNLVLVKLVKL